MKYRINVRISHDELDETHQPGDEVDLSEWPQDVLDLWTLQGKITPLKEKRRKVKGQETKHGQDR